MVAQDAAQGRHRVGVRLGPMHSAALEARFDHQLVGALDAAAADREAPGGEVHIRQHVPALAEVVAGAVPRLAGRQGVHRRQDRAGVWSWRNAWRWTANHALVWGVPGPKAAWAASARYPAACAKSRIRTACGQCRSTNSWIHGAPSLTATTTGARSTPRRMISPSATCPKFAASVKRA